MDNQPSRKDTFDSFYGKSPSVSPVSSSTNLIVDFSMAVEDLEFVQGFQKKDSSILQDTSHKQVLSMNGLSAVSYVAVHLGIEK
eukprot:762138-Hanusia_phi.AAC.5